MSVKYNGNSITIPASNQDKNLLVYSHPGDDIKFDFDISFLDKKIINGDLVIYLLNGRTITLVNYGLMALDDKAPTLSDVTQTYTPFSLFDNSYYYEDNGVAPYVISRQISSPDNNALPPGNKLASSEEIFPGEWSFFNNNSRINENGDPNNNDAAPAVQEYIMKTLFSNYTKLEQSVVNYASNDKQRYNDPNIDIYPIKLLLINPKITPEYGTSYSLIKSKEHPGYKDLTISIGGGKLQGNDYAHYMYNPETIDLSIESNRVWFDGHNQGDMVTRWFYMGLPNPTIIIDKIIISGLPSGVKIPKNLSSNLIVKQLGGGTFEIAVKGAPAGGVEIPLIYKLGLGGEEGLYSAVSITYEGTQTRSGDAVKGSVTSFFEFKPVRSAYDISNYDKFNTFTYSTLRDPLKIWFTSNDDVIKGGKGNYIYYGNAGDNKAYGGEADEVFHLGSGNNSFYVGLGNAIVDVDNVNKNNAIYLSDAIKKADKGSVRTTIDNGKINFSGKSNGKTFTTTATDFTSLYFDIGDNNEVTDRSDTLTIVSTKYLKANINAYLGKGEKLEGNNWKGNIVEGADNPMTIEVKANAQNIFTIFIRTNDTLNGVFVNWDNNSNSYILGSSKNDTIVGSDIDIPISFDGSGRGENTADYSNVSLNLIYYASTGKVIKESSSSGDVIKGIKNFIGGLGKTTFYGSTSQNINYFGSQNSIEEENTLSYLELESGGDNTLTNGVTIDLSRSVVIKHKTRGEDKFFKIGKIESSNNNDIFIMSGDPISRTLDGLGGFNTVDYSKLDVTSVFNFTKQISEVIVSKGEGGNYGSDTARSFRHFIGSMGGSTFKFDNQFNSPGVLNRNNGSDIRFILEGKASETSNEVNYASIAGKGMILDLNLGDSTATIYEGKEAGKGKILAKDKLINIGKFFLSKEAENIIYAYDAKILEYLIDGGVNGNNTISFEKSKKSINVDFRGGLYNNLTSINKLILSQYNDTVILGPYCFGESIDGGGGINKVDFTSVVGPLVLEINLLNINFVADVGNGNKITFKNFQQIISSLGNDKYTIVFDLKDAEKIKNKDILIDGNLGQNIIDFTKVSNSTGSKQGLTIDLSAEYSSVKDIKGNNILKFINFTKIYGSKYDDTFILPKGASFYEIDGVSTTEEGALNAVSYQAYINGIYINKDIFKKFKNIQKIIGTQGDDVIELDKDTEFNIDGYDGFNTLSYSKEDSFESVTVNISNKELPDIGVKSFITIDKGNGKKDTLNTIAFINFENTTVTNGVKFEINNKDNIHLNKKGKVFLSGSKVEEGKDANSKIIYKEDLTEITLNLQIEMSQIVSGSWISVTKGTGNSVDYLQNFNEITLSRNSKVNVFDNIGTIKNVRNLTIDGRDESTLSFEYYSMGLTLNVKELNLEFQNRTIINFKGFTKFTASRVIDTKFTFLSASDKNYIFNGLESECTLSYKNLEEDITINVSANTKLENRIFNTITINKANTTDKAYNVVHFFGSQGVTKVLVNYSFQRNMTFTGDGKKKNENSIDYSGLSEKDNITFNISKEGVLVGRSSGEYNDTIKNINKIIGGKGNARFSIEGDVIGLDNTYYLDGGEGTNILSLTNIDTNLIYHLDTEGKINVNINNIKFASVKNIHILFGTSSKLNNFKLGNFYEGKYIAVGNLQLYGNGNNGEDTLDLTETNKGLSLNPLSGRIVESNSNEKLAIVTMNGISTILLGDGNHQIDISNKTSNVGWKKIVGGKGQNNVSFDNMVTSINYNLAEGVDGLSFQLINFTGVTGTRSNDTFYLTENKIQGIRINGNGGIYNILDYSKLDVAITVDIFNKKVTRGDKTDTVENINIFKSGKAGGRFISTENGFYEFHGLGTATNKSTIDYSSVNTDLIFSFINNSVIKPNNFYDKFYNITEFIGGSGENNNFLFALSDISPKINEIVLDGGKGKNNIVNLVQLEKGIIYDIDKKFFEVDNHGITLKVILKNINSFIGSSHQDTFIFSDTTNGITINGGNNIDDSDNIIDLSRVSNSVTVDFAIKTISYGNNKNYFINVHTFIGSKKGGDVFRGLNNYTLYTIIGGAGGNNTVIYNGSTTPLIVKVENQKVVIFKGGISDKLTNIQNLVLTDFADKLILNEISDLKVLSVFKTIDGGQGDNQIHINFKTKEKDNTIIDLEQGKITYNNTTYDINLKNFRGWVVSKEGFNPNSNYTIVANKDFSGLRSVRFAGMSNYSQGYYNTLDASKFSGNIYLSLIEKTTTNMKMSLSSITLTSSVYLENVTRIILPIGNHSIDYGKVVYNGNGGSTYNLKVEAIDASKTGLNYLFESITNEVGKTYLCIDGIKFAEKGTKSDIIIAGKTSIININKLISLKDNVVLLFDSANTISEASSTIYLRDWRVRDNTFVVRTLDKDVYDTPVSVKFLNGETTAVVLGKRILSLVFLNKNNMANLVLDATINSRTNYIEFYTYKTTFSTVNITNISEKGKEICLKFSEMDKFSGGGAVYAKFDPTEQVEFYSYLMGGVPSESKPFFTLNLPKISKPEYYIPTITIDSSLYDDFYEYVFTDKKLGEKQKFSASVVAKDPNTSYTVKITFSKKFNEVKIKDLEVNLDSQGMNLRDKDANKNLLTFVMHKDEATTALVKKNIIINLNTNDIFFNRLSYEIKFEVETQRALKNIILPSPSVTKQVQSTINITFDSKFFTEKSVSQVYTIFDIRMVEGSPFVDMNHRVGNWDTNILNIPLVSNGSFGEREINKFVLTSTSWYNTEKLFSNTLYLQSSDGTTLLGAFYQNVGYLGKEIHLTDNKISSYHYFTFDASSMPFGVKNNLISGDHQEFIINFTEISTGVIKFYQGDKGFGYHSILEVYHANSIKIQREDVSFPVYILFKDFNKVCDDLSLGKYGTSTLFSFGDMKKMKLPPNKDYQIFSVDDSFLPKDKQWVGPSYNMGNIAKTYTNVVDMEYASYYVTFDANNNNTFTFSSNSTANHQSVNISGCNNLIINDSGSLKAELNKAGLLNIAGLDEKNPFVILIKKNVYTKNGDSCCLEITPNALPSDNVVLRFLRGDQKIDYQGTSRSARAMTFTNDYEYNDPNFKYYGSIISAFSRINIKAPGYTIKSYENRDRTAKELKASIEQDRLPVKEILMVNGIYSFEGVDKGNRYSDGGKKEFSSSAIIVFKNSLQGTKEVGFYVTDYAMVNSMNVPGGELTNFWYRELNNLTRDYLTHYGGVRKIIISGHQLEGVDVVDNKKFSNLRIVFDICEYILQGDNITMIQRGTFKGDPRDKKAVDKYLNDRVTFDLAGIGGFAGDRGKIDCTILFNGKDIACCFNEQKFLLKDMCAGFHCSLDDNKYKNEVTTIGQGCENFNFILGTELLVPDLMLESSNKTLYFYYEFSYKGTHPYVVVPKRTNIEHSEGEGFTYKYKIESLDGWQHKDYRLIVNIKNLETGEYCMTYNIRFKITARDPVYNIDFTYVDTQADFYRYIDENHRDLYNLTLAGNDTKIDLDKYKNAVTQEKYITWNNQQEYLDSLDKTSATKDYWSLIDKYLEDALKITTTSTNNTNEESQRVVNGESTHKQDNNSLEEEIYFVENNDTNHNHIFESSYYEDSLEKQSSYNEDRSPSYELNEADIDQEDYEEYNTEEDSVNHSYQDSSILDNEDNLTLDQNTQTMESINLSNLFEKVKSISENIDNTTLVEEFGLSNLTLEELNHTYQQDEANSMAYTIDGCNNIASNYSNDYTIETTTQENQKNKTNH